MYGVLAPQPFEEAGSPSPPTSPSSTNNPYEQTLSRYRSSSFSTRSSINGVVAGSGGTSPIAETKEGGKKKWSLRRKNTNERSLPAGGMDLMGEVAIVGEESEPELEIVPPAWKRRTSQIVRDRNRGEGSLGVQGQVEEEETGLGEPRLSPPVPAFTKQATSPGGSGSGNGEEQLASPGSSTSSLVPEQGTITPRPGLAPSRRSSMYTGIAVPATGSPLSKTTQEHEHHRHLRAASQVGGFEGMIPDMSNPTRPSGERPLDTVRRMSMISDGGSFGEKGGRRKAKPPANAKRTISQGISLVGIPMDDGIWPVMPLENGGPYGLAYNQKEKNRSVISLTSVNHASVKSKSTPGSPITNGRRTISRSSSRSNLSTGTIGPAGSGLTMTAANRAQYVQTMQREYSMRLGGTGREGGYAIAATMTGGGGLGRNGSSVGDFGSLRHSGEWSSQQGAFYDHETASSSRPSLPFGSRSNSTSATSLSLMVPGQDQHYPASQISCPPSAYPPSLPTSMTSSPVLQKTPSPLSQTVSASTGVTAESAILNPDEEFKSGVGAQTGLAPPLPVVDIPITDPHPSPPVPKNKKELAREAKEAKLRAQREVKEQAIKRVEMERKRKEQAKLEKERAKEQAKQAKKAKSVSMKPPAKVNKESGSTPVQSPAAAVNRPGEHAAVTTNGTSRSGSIPTPSAPSRSTSNNRISVVPVNKLIISNEQDKTRSTDASAPAPAPSPLKKKQSFWESMRKKFSSGPEQVVKQSNSKTNTGGSGNGKVAAPVAITPVVEDQEVRTQPERQIEEVGTESDRVESEEVPTPVDELANEEEMGMDLDERRENGYEAEDAYENLRVQTPHPPSVSTPGSIYSNGPDDLQRIASAESSQRRMSHGSAFGRPTTIDSLRRRSHSSNREMERYSSQEGPVILQAQAI